jgi:undecaprenyl-diphosphatase
MDATILTWIHGHSHPVLDVLFRFSNELGTFPFCASLVVLMTLWHVARNERREALAWLVLGLTIAGVVGLLKGVTDRPRPTLWPHLVAVSGSSFPSGHATAGAALFPLLGWIALRARPRGRVVGWALGVGVGIFVGVGRLYLGVHWPSDVLAGWALGAALSAGAIAWLRPPTLRERIGRRRRGPPPRRGTGSR